MSVAADLAPELSTSWEIGMELKFFQNRTRLDVAYYSTVTDRQIVQVRVSPSAGHILMTRNEGTVKNHGVEIQFDQDIFRKKNLSWIVGLNIGLNRGTVTKLPDGIIELQGGQYGDIFASAYLGESMKEMGLTAAGHRKIKGEQQEGPRECKLDDLKSRFGVG